MIICYDVFFADPARTLATKGAELILMPIRGGDETLAKARAIENKVFPVKEGRLVKTNLKQTLDKVAPY